MVAGLPVELTGWVRVVAWNVQRGRRPAELALRLGESGADLCLLSELDRGMARTENTDVTAAIAADLGARYAFGVEFVELGLGDASEQREAAGLLNVSGLHGNAIVTRAPLGDPCVVRLPDDRRPGLVRGRLPPAPRRRSHGRRRHGHDRRSRGGGRLGASREPQRPRAQGRTDGGAVAGD